MHILLLVYTHYWELELWHLVTAIHVEGL
jgi:hypothetical protein